MRKLFATLFIASLFFASCKKENQTPDSSIVGKWRWIAQYQGAPSNTLNPQNTGIEETLILNSGGTWSVIQNTNTSNSGTFKTYFQTSSRGEKVNALSYRSRSNTDSAVYYKIYNDTLLFSYDLMGTIGDGARYYIKQP